MCPAARMAQRAPRYWHAPASHDGDRVKLFKFVWLGSNTVLTGTLATGKRPLNLELQLEVRQYDIQLFQLCRPPCPSWSSTTHHSQAPEDLYNLNRLLTVVAVLHLLPASDKLISSYRHNITHDRYIQLKVPRVGIYLGTRSGLVQRRRIRNSTAFQNYLYHLVLSESADTVSRLYMHLVLCMSVSMCDARSIPNMFILT